MQESGRGEGPDEVERALGLRPGRQVEGGHGEEQVHVLHVVQVGAAHPLDVLVRATHFPTQVVHVLRIGEHLKHQC